MARYVALLLVAVLSACGGGPVRLGVLLRSDHDAAGLERVVTELRAVGSDGATLLEELFELPPGADLTDDLRVAEWEVPPGRYEITVSLEGPERLHRQVAIVELSAHRDVIVVISRSCDEVSCPGPGEDPASTSCLAGACVSPACVPSPEDCATSCTFDDDCPDDDGLVCVVPRCVGGACARVADDSLCDGDAVCNPVRGCELDTCEAVETACADGRDGDCDGRVDCLDDDCLGATCDDGDACTDNDACGADGVCAPTANTASGAPCPDDGNSCTRDECDGAGACTHPAEPNGTRWPGGDFARCCGGVEALITDRQNCGGCGIQCPGTRACNLVRIWPETEALPACDCVWDGNNACPGRQTCVFANYCSCADNGDCPAGLACRMQARNDGGLFNACSY